MIANHNSGFPLLDNRWTMNAFTNCQSVVIIDWGIDRMSALMEVNITIAFERITLPGTCVGASDLIFGATGP